MTRLSAKEIRQIKQAQDDADRQRLRTATPEDLRQAWEDRMTLYRELWPNSPKPGTQEWSEWRFPKKRPSGQ